MPRWVKLIYAVSIVFPVLKQTLIHLYGIGTDSYNEIKEKWQEAWGK